MFKALRKWLNRRSRKTSEQDTRVPFSDPVIGDVKPHASIAGAYASQIQFQDRRIELLIDPLYDAKTLEQSLPVAHEVANSIEDLNRKALEMIEATHRQNYNDNWRAYTETIEDGNTRDVEDPELSSDDFKAKLKFEGVSVEGLGLTLWYSDGGLFAGHAFHVTAFDGPKFEDVDVMMAG